MKLAFIGTYPPRQCGIGTFTNNLVKAVAQSADSRRIARNIMVIAINERNQKNINYPEEVSYTIRQNHQRDYIDAAKYINYSDADVCVLQHEFGIFDGDEGVFILPLIHRLQVPLIVTLHTIVKSPNYTQRSIIEEIGKKAAGIVVMSRRAVDLLNNIYNIPCDKIHVIEHGVPEYEKVSRKAARQRHNLVGRKLLLTFGLLSRNKGIETVIAALPQVIRKHPDVLYMVLGATHPNVLKHSGEEYREFLWRMVKKLGLEKHVYFKNEFANEALLFEYLNACDIYITPYLNEAQITSGTLAYALGSGCAVVSTPYWHAAELVQDNKGRLFDFKNHEQLAVQLTDLLGNEKELELIRQNSLEYGKSIRWPRIGKQYLELAETLKFSLKETDDEERQPIDLRMLPLFNIEHIKRLTDDTGIIQHAKYGIPNLKEGYCIDDNSRALLMMLMAFRQNKDEGSLRLMYKYTSFIHYMQRENGKFRNHLSFSRQYLDEYGSEDSFGRAVWALGYMICYPPNDVFRQIGKEIFDRAKPQFSNLNSLRGIANTMLGICYYLKKNQTDEEMVQELKRLSSVITSSYKQYATFSWRWFEKILTYDNAILPLALFSSYEITGDSEVHDIAMEATGFLESLTLSSGYFCAVGNMGWAEQGKAKAEYDQQPLDAMAMVLLYYQLFEITKDVENIQKLFNCYMWFLGENSLRLPLFDNETNGCCDGLEKGGVNRNQGAESSLAYWISHLTVMAAQEKEHLFFRDKQAVEIEFSANGHYQREAAPESLWGIFKGLIKKG